MNSTDSTQSEGSHSKSRIDMMDEVARLRQRVAELESCTTLRDSDPFVEQLFAQSKDLLCTIGFDGFPRKISPSFQAMLGYSEEEMLSHEIWEYLHPEDAPLIRDKFEQLKVGHRTTSVQSRSRCVDGTYRWIEWSATPNPDAQLFYAIGRDVTQEKFHPEHLSLHSELLEALFQSSVALICVLDLDGNILVANDRLVELLDLPASLSATAQPGGVPTKAARLLSRECLPLQRVLGQAEAIFDEHVIFPTPHGRRHFSINAAPLRDRSGHRTGAVLSFLDITELKRTELSLRDSETKFQLIADLAPVMIWTADANGFFQYFSKPWVDCAGPNSDDDQSGEWMSGVHPDDRDECQRAFHHAFTSQTPFQNEFRLRRQADGEFRWIINTGVPRHDDRGRFEGFVGSCLDITDRKRAETALQQSEEVYRSMFENHLSPKLLVAPNTGLITDANPAACHFYHQSRQELLGRKLHDLQLRPDPLFDAQFRMTCSEVVQFSACQQRLGNGEVRTVEMFTSPLTVAGHTMVQIDVRDVSEREHATQELADQTARLSAIMHAAADAIITVDETGKIDTFNRAAEKMFGIEAGKLVGTSVRTLMPCPREINAPFNSAELWQRGIDEGLPSGKRADGSIFPVDVSISQICAGSKCTYVAIIRDISERMQLEEQLRQSQKMEAIGRLSGGIAHDFNNSLAVITGYSELILQGLEPDNPIAADLQQIHRAADRSASLTRQLLAFSRKQLLQPTILNINTILGDMKNMLGRLIGEDVRMVTELTPKLPNIRADAGQIEQVIMNLAVNARDAMVKGGTLRLSTSIAEIGNPAPRGELSQLSPGDYVLLMVSDDGHGMDQETQKSIFEPFFTTKPVDKGTGLGLSTVYGIVRQSDGAITVWSQPGEGTVFSIYLPAIPAETNCTPTAISSDDRYANGSANILVVEDDAAFRQLLKHMLSRLGFNVLVASDGADAVGILSAPSTPPLDLVITDVVMPKMGGAELGDLIREHWPELSVLYMSGYTDETIFRARLTDPNIAILHKPFNQDTLREKINERLKARATRH